VTTLQTGNNINSRTTLVKDARATLRGGRTIKYWQDMELT
jgi:hypothetical protein